MKKLNFILVLWFLCTPLILKSNQVSQILVSWTDGIEGEYELHSVSVKQGNNNDYFISGSFYGTIIIDNDTLKAQNGRDGFIGRVDFSGQLKWTIVLESKSYCQVNLVKQNEDDKIYFTGSFRDTIEHGDFLLTSQKYLSTFAGKINSNGQLLWIKDLGINSLGSNHFLQITNYNSIYFATTFTGNIKIDDNIANERYNRQIFVSKLSDNGYIEDYKIINSNSSLELGGFNIAENNKLLLGGSFTDSTYFDNQRFFPEGTKDVFIIQTDSIFEIENSNIIEGKGYKELKGLKTFDNGNYIVYGEFRGKMNIGTQSYKPKHMKGLYLAQFDNEGNPTWKQTISGMAEVNFSGSSINKSNNEIYFLFNYRGNIELNGKQYSTEDFVFEHMLAKYQDDGTLKWVKPADNEKSIKMQISPNSNDGKITAAVKSKGDTLNLWENDYVKDDIRINFIKLYDCDYALFPEPLTDTAICPGSKLDAGKGFETYLWNQSHEDRFFEPDSSGLYNLKIKDHTGCIYMDTLYVEMLPGIEVEIEGDTNFCPDGTTVLDAGNAYNYLWNTGSEERYLYVSESGEYSVVIENQYQCADSANIYVDEFEVPMVNIEDEIHMQLGEEITLNPGDFDEYYWSNGSTDPKLKIIADSLGTGSFEKELKVIDYNECVQHKNFKIIVEESTAVVYNDLENFCDIKLYPNPGNEYINLEYGCSGNECEAELIVFDTQGRPVYEDKIYAKEKISLHGLDPGTYFIRLFNAQKQCSAKKFTIVK